MSNVSGSFAMKITRRSLNDFQQKFNQKFKQIIWPMSDIPESLLKNYVVEKQPIGQGTF